MSFLFTPTTITLTRGDTFSLPVDFHQSIEGATISIFLFDEAGVLPVVEKHIKDHVDAEKGKSILLLEKEETLLPVGRYQIQMTITFLDGARYTFFPPRPEGEATLVITKK